MLSIEEGLIVFVERSALEVGTVRYSPSFRIKTKDVVLIGYAPRLIIDDKSGFLILVDRKCKVHYFNVDVVGSEALRQLEKQFEFSLQHDTRYYSWDDYKAGITEVIYPTSLRGKPLFKSWSWFSPRGFMKNISYKMSMGNPMWDRITNEMKAYINSHQPNRVS
ncbi:hypothetical protein MTX78_09300 [Hymenobacter tibetensis]|uniref:Uncharacterized protein n=1 Tax=Hymenobacter tibetensis TaxID=497967 RepID=A0ABY4D6C9_9BACT|nr:hypothetical protein [Hymenobacter tibetensis]UOG76781.1 hypothetical protein MTX78_09300 [Hymenobacter tibetensis]